MKQAHSEISTVEDEGQVFGGNGHSQDFDPEPFDLVYPDDPFPPYLPDDFDPQDPIALLPPIPDPTDDWDPSPPPEPPQGPLDTAELKKARSSRILHLRTVAEVEQRTVGWLWPRWLPHGFCWLEGDPATNKSMLAILIAALTTTGRPYPGETSSRPPRCALYLTSGEDPDEIIRDRFLHAGGDPHRLFLLDVRRIMTDPAIPEAARGLPILPTDASRIVETAHSCSAALIILDAAYSFVSTANDIFNDHQLRAAIEPFARMTADASITALGLRHLTKTKKGAQHQGVGAVAGGAVARSVLILNKDAATGPSARVLGCTKSSYAALPDKQLAFEVKADGPLGAAWLVYTGESEVSVGKSTALARDTKGTEGEQLYRALHQAFEAAFKGREKIPIRGASGECNVDAIAEGAGYAESGDFTASRYGRRIKAAFKVEAVQDRAGKKVTWCWQSKGSPVRE